MLRDIFTLVFVFFAENLFDLSVHYFLKFLVRKFLHQPLVKNVLFPYDALEKLVRLLVLVLFVNCAF